MKKSLQTYLTIAIVAGITVLPGCMEKKEGPVLAKVGMAKIYQEDLDERINQFPTQTQVYLQDNQNKVKLLDQMVDELVLVKYAKKQGVNRSDDYKSQLAEAKKQLLLAQLIQEKVDQNVEIDDTEVAAFYEENKDQFQAVERRRVAHILTKTQAEAEKARQELRSGKSFESVARKMSIDPSKENGGELGWITKDQVVPEFAKAAFAIKNKGRRTGIVKSQFGFHIIKLLDTNVRPPVSMEQASAQIQQQLTSQKRQQAFDNMLKEAKESVKISKNVSELK